MQVFKTFMKTVKSHLNVFIIYIACFVTICVIVSMSSDSTEQFEASKIKVSVTDMDNTPESRALCDYIGSIAEVVDIDFEKQDYQEALFYRRVNAVLTIEKGCGEKLSNGETDGILSEYNLPGTFSAELFDSQLNRYVSMYNACRAGGLSADEAAAKTSELCIEEAEVELVSFNNEYNSKYDIYIASFFQYIPYIMISIFITGLCPSILVFTGKDIRNRINCSALSSSKQTAQTAAGTIVVSFGVFILFMAVAAVLYSDNFFGISGMYAMLNALTFTIVAMTITLLIAVCSPTISVLNMIAQVIGLGMSFLCGVFVPQSVLSDSVLRIGRFLPAYWYVRANNLLSAQANDNFTNKRFFICIGIQLAFAAAIFCAAMLVSKTRRSSKTAA